MSLLATTDDAEQVARSWMEKRYGDKLGKVSSSKSWGKEGSGPSRQG